MKNPLCRHLRTPLILKELNFKCAISRGFDLFINFSGLAQIWTILDVPNFLIHICAYWFDNNSYLRVLLSNSPLEILGISLILFFIVIRGSFMAGTICTKKFGEIMNYQCSMEIIICPSKHSSNSGKWINLCLSLSILSKSVFSSILLFEY